MSMCVIRTKSLAPSQMEHSRQHHNNFALIYQERERVRVALALVLAHDGNSFGARTHQQRLSRVCVFVIGRVTEKDSHFACLLLARSPFAWIFLHELILSMVWLVYIFQIYGIHIFIFAVARGRAYSALAICPECFHHPKHTTFPISKIPFSTCHFITAAFRLG